MSMHKIPLTPLEEEGMRLHGLPIGTPSQRSDTFRQGVAWAIGEAKRLTEENERLRAVLESACEKMKRCRYVEARSDMLQAIDAARGAK